MHNIILLPLPSNALERSSALTLGLITGYFPWVKSSGITCHDSPKIVLDNSWFIDMVKAERFLATPKNLLLNTQTKKTFARELVPAGTYSACWFATNQRKYTVSDNSPIAGRAIQWYDGLLLHKERAAYMTGFNNGIVLHHMVCVLPL